MQTAILYEFTVLHHRNARHTDNSPVQRHSFLTNISRFKFGMKQHSQQHRVLKTISRHASPPASLAILKNSWLTQLVHFQTRRARLV